MTAALLAGLLLVGTTAPYLLPMDRLKPITGVAVWLMVLLLRAILVLLGVFSAVLYLPSTELFQLATHWCIHAVIPFFATHLGFSGHSVGDAAIVLPALVLALSAISALFAVLRAARVVRRWLHRGTLGRGPGESVIVGGESVVVAAAGVRGARIVVSTGALLALDEDELTASLEHERGHIARRHPYLALGGSLACGLARILPGSADALRQLHFYLERDADEYAVQRTGNPLALASAICKAALDQPGLEPAPAIAGLSGPGAPTRLRFLLDRSSASSRGGSDYAARGLVAFLVGLVLLVGAMSPTLARAGIAAAGKPVGQHLCES